MPRGQLNKSTSDVLKSSEAAQRSSAAPGGVTSQTRRKPPSSDPKPREQGNQTAKKRQRLPRETRAQLLERLNNPLISLHEASVLLRVCPATVRRYTNSGLLPCVRTTGQQRRFYFRDVLALHQRRCEAKNKRIR